MTADSPVMPDDIRDLCELIDCQVIRDVDTNPITKQAQTVFALGAYPDTSAGLHGYTLTPYFFSEDALARFCRSPNGKMRINKIAAELFPDWDPVQHRFTEA